MTCKYKVKIKDIQYNYKVQMTDIQSKYKFKVFCTGYDDSEIKDKIDAMYEAWPKASGEGETITLNDTANTTMSIDLKGNTSQDGTPTPDDPVAVSVVSGDNSIKVEGKNLFDIVLDSSIGNTILYKTYTLQPNTQYTISTNTYLSSNVIANIFAQAGTSLTPKTLVNGVNGSKTITSDENGNITLGYRNYQNELDYSSGNYYTQLEKGETATSYEPYQSQTYPISLGNIELCKIGDYQDSIVKDNGKWYLNKQIGKVVLDGSEANWSNQFGINLFSLQAFLNNNKFIVGYGLSNYYKYNSIQSGINAGTVNGEFALQESSGNYNLFMKNTDYSSTDNFKAWLVSNNVSIYYPLQTPTYTEITDSTLISQLEAIKEAESYSGQTNISQTNDDKPFILTAKALKDLSNL